MRKYPRDMQMIEGFPMKKLFGLLVVLSLCTFSVAAIGCGGDTTTGTDTEASSEGGDDTGGDADADADGGDADADAGS